MRTKLQSARTRDLVLSEPCKLSGWSRRLQRFTLSCVFYPCPFLAPYPFHDRLCQDFHSSPGLYHGPCLFHFLTLRIYLCPDPWNVDPCQTHLSHDLMPYAEGSHFDSYCGASSLKTPGTHPFYLSSQKLIFLQCSSDTNYQCSFKMKHPKLTRYGSCNSWIL